LVSIITCTIREECIDNVFQNYEQQNYPDKELIIILNKDSMNIDWWKKRAEQYENVRVYQLYENATLGDCLNFGVVLSKYDYIAKFDDDDYYGPSYLSSAMADFKKHEISVWGKSSYYIYFKNRQALIFVPNVEDAPTDYLSGATLIFKKEIFKTIRFEKVNRAEDYFFIVACIENGLKVYSANRYHYATIRHDPENHTWKISEEELMDWGNLVAYTDDFQSIVSNEEI
jgi:glycosyltransferase involved in cell wall biosynthesis